MHWWERGTPLWNDFSIALEVLGCTVGEYYRRTTPKERYANQLYFATKAARQEFAEQAAEWERQARRPTEQTAPFREA